MRFSNHHPEYKNINENVLNLIGEVRHCKHMEEEEKVQKLFSIIEDAMLSAGELRVSIPKVQVYHTLGGIEQTENAIGTLVEEGLGCVHSKSSSFTFFFPLSKERSSRISYLNAEIRCTRSYRINRAKDKVFTLIRLKMKEKKTLKVTIPKVIVFAEVEYGILEEVLSALFEDGIQFVENNGNFIFFIE